MPTKTFSSFEPFFEAIRHTNLRAMVLGPDRGSWALSNLSLKNLSVQFGEASGNAVVEGSPLPGGVSIFMMTQGLSAMTGNGRRFDDCTLFVGKPGDEFCLAADASERRWCSLYLPSAELGAATGDTSPAVASTRGVIRLPVHQMVQLRSVIQGLEEAFQQAPDAFNSPAAQNAAWQKMIPEICTVLAVPQADGLPHGRLVPRTQIIHKAMHFIEQHDGEYLSVEQLAASAGVSERTLRDAFQQYFGLGPVQYLNRRTLHQVRKALKVADPSVATVTKIATEFGVWQLGRFARDYRILFHELPSETLRRALH